MTDTVAAPAATAGRAILGALVRKLLAVVGAALATRGLIDADTANSISGYLAEAIVGGILVAASTGWSLARAQFEHSRWALAWNTLMKEAAPTPPSPLIALRQDMENHRTVTTASIAALAQRVDQIAPAKTGGDDAAPVA